MPRFTLSEGARNKVDNQIDRLFDNLLGRFVGPGPKVLAFAVDRDPILSLPGVFASATVEGGTSTMDKDLLNSLIRISTNYINGIRERTKAKVLNEVESAVARSGTEGLEAALNDLQGRLADAWIGVTADIKRVVETEISNASNQGIHSSIVRVSDSMGISDPTVFKVIVHDDRVCEICLKLWVSDDGITPRVYRMSELQHGYMTDHRHPYPSVGQTHPHCRCSLSTLLPGFGFNNSGHVTWISPEHDELKKQRK